METEIPSCLSSDNVSPFDLYAKLLIQLDHLQNVFLVDRLVDRGQAYQSTELLQVSIDVISIIMVFWTHQNLLTGFRYDNEWLVMGVARPAAGILCLELVQAAAVPPSHTSKRSPLAVSRSVMIKNLSMLAGFLNWMRPLVGERKTCSSLETMVRHVLDHTLDAPASGGEAVVPTAQITVDRGAEYAKMTNETWDGWNLDLLDTFDWMRSDFDISSTVT
ncbi:hypothetical protein NQ176_g6054 [Zarea fungicola]|uniref:Uncharacterized protein n=1 Tax=Zarea fungicola TaxID=93591 RepID=A0ACC1N7I9_9HYPO|nr:hypothetical protein NQ176_g6054 [Lecanicillium fungicola]